MRVRGFKMTARQLIDTLEGYIAATGDENLKVSVRNDYGLFSNIDSCILYQDVDGKDIVVFKINEH